MTEELTSYCSCCKHDDEDDVALQDDDDDDGELVDSDPLRSKSLLATCSTVACFTLYV